ncbi:MAG: type II 3-dehydroquinate dehydratase [Oscillospiraceae bacterium]|nr:type II 3-dehydroquinate dehydratase [Oscillospiraceae bacterium]
MKKVLVLHGPNINMIGEREPSIYGKETYDDINSDILKESEAMGIDCEIFFSNHEGALVDRIQAARKKHDGMIINAGALSHYSYSIRDAIASVLIPCIEIHCSNIYKREEFRHHSVISPVCAGCITGFGKQSYILALHGLKKML